MLALVTLPSRTYIGDRPEQAQAQLTPLIVGQDLPAQELLLYRVCLRALGIMRTGHMLRREADYY